MRLLLNLFRWVQVLSSLTGLRALRVQVSEPHVGWQPESFTSRRYQSSSLDQIFPVANVDGGHVNIIQSNGQAFRTLRSAVGRFRRMPLSRWRRRKLVQSVAGAEGKSSNASAKKGRSSEAPSAAAPVCMHSMDRGGLDNRIMIRHYERPSLTGIVESEPATYLKPSGGEFSSHGMIPPAQDNRSSDSESSRVLPNAPRFPLPPVREAMQWTS